MMLEHLVDTENDNVESLLETYTTVPLEKIERIQQQVIRNMERDLTEYISKLWVPTKLEELGKPFMMNTFPAFLRERVVTQLDNLYPEKEILLKFHQYSVLCNSFVTLITESYHQRYAQTVRELGGPLVNNHNAN